MVIMPEPGHEKGAPCVDGDTVLLSYTFTHLAKSKKALDNWRDERGMDSTIEASCMGIISPT